MALEISGFAKALKQAGARASTFEVTMTGQKPKEAKLNQLISKLLHLNKPFPKTLVLITYQLIQREMNFR